MDQINPRCCCLYLSYLLNDQCCVSPGWWFSRGLKNFTSRKKKKKLVTPTNTKKEIGGDTGLCRIGAKWFKYRCMGSLRKTNGVFGGARLDISSTGKVYRDSTTQKTKLQIIFLYVWIYLFLCSSHGFQLGAIDSCHSFLLSQIRKVQIASATNCCW